MIELVLREIMGNIVPEYFFVDNLRYVCDKALPPAFDEFPLLPCFCAV